MAPRLGIPYLEGIEPNAARVTWLVRASSHLQLRDSAGIRPDFPLRNAWVWMLSVERAYLLARAQSRTKVAIGEKKSPAVPLAEPERDPEPGQDGESHELARPRGQMRQRMHE